ncbi:beta-galactosidase trimerization domain-containing protein [Caldanaerobius polysaccharolyticus]|uniref:beta-galactosidase trimerization domain-containing protein n=1 Tax=Caldanaerobius polysaccharolyticus TaxID=44256 RepID=UPI001C54DD05|nr:beta-galactosidase trimerization domain-containing protein [Caldanaerobius polysaccharolyticus]
MTEIGVFTPEEFYGAEIGGLPPAIMGANRMLEEAGYQFDIIDSQSDFSRYRVLVLPDNIPVSEEFAEKLDKYVADGGAIIASFESGLNEDKSAFSVKSFGIRLKGEAPYSPDFILPQGEIGKGLPETEHVMYMRGLEVEAEQGAEVLAYAVVPYFNRTWEHFCSHRHTPSSGKIGYPGVLKNGSVIYFMHPIFTQYNQNAPRWCKQLFVNALNILLPDPLIKHNGPSTMLVTLNEQEQQNRWVLHLLHYIPERRSQEIDTIEDIIPLYNIKVSVKSPCKVKEVMCVPEGKPLDFNMNGDRVEFVVPKVNGHQMVAIITH